MRAVIQRVSQASVSLSSDGGKDDTPVGEINAGLVILIAVGRDDTSEDATYLVDKITNLRIFPDAAQETQRFDLSALDVNAELLIISQFTLYADTRKGRRPSFTDAAPPDVAFATFDDIVQRFKATGLRVETGTFQAHMNVALTNDGPVTITLDTADRQSPRR
ncbi:MAG: D-aminoacyl-tRNA deacylase [Chloroflexi bacterium]|nr:D-aminoacyl-tRNA deacylase [Chloroflexota bacterium]